MANVSGVSGSSNGNLSASGSNSLADISQTEFLQLLLAQLQNQNPLNPMSDTDFATQLATLSEVGSLNNLNTNFGSLLQVQQLSGASALIGRTATYTPSDSSAAQQGTIAGLNVQGDGTLDLLVNGTNVSLGQVNSIN